MAAVDVSTDSVFSRQSGLRLGLRNPLQNGWNWGAFFFSWLWMFNHGYPRRALMLLVLDLIPGAGFIAHIHCGLAGNDIAFDGRRFASSEEYLAVQSAWRNSGLVLTLLVVVFATLVFSGSVSPGTIGRLAAPQFAGRIRPDQVLKIARGNIRRTSSAFSAGEAHLVRQLSMARVLGQIASVIHTRPSHATPARHRVIAALARTATAHAATTPAKSRSVARASATAPTRAEFDAAKAEARAQLQRAAAAVQRQAAVPVVVAEAARPVAPSAPILRHSAQVARSTGNACEAAIGAVNASIATTSAHAKYDASVSALQLLNACRQPSVVLQAQSLALESKAIAEHAQGLPTWQSDLDSSITIGNRCAIDLDGDGTHGSDRCRATATVGAQLRTEWRRPILLGQL